MSQWKTESIGPASNELAPVRKATLDDLRLTPQTEQPLNWREGVLLKALKLAIYNGWTGWKTHVNDAVTVGQEAEGVLRDYRRGQKPIEPLIFDHDFARAAGYDLVGLVLSTDRMKHLREVL